jgi:hypothetical protein
MTTEPLSGWAKDDPARPFLDKSEGPTGEYHVTWGDNPTEMIRLVNEYILRGWRVVHFAEGPSISSGGGKLFYAYLRRS